MRPKLRAGMEKALQRAPVPRAELDEALSRVVHKLRSSGTGKCPRARSVSW